MDRVTILGLRRRRVMLTDILFMVIIDRVAVVKFG
jgi:hypothetical protein